MLQTNQSMKDGEFFETANRNGMKNSALAVETSVALEASRQSLPILTAASWRIKPGGLPCLE
jgi:hypothetical protein